MNELDIREAVDRLMQQAESELEVIFSRALDDVLKELLALYNRHHNKNIPPSYTSLNRYNRVHSMLNRIVEDMTSEYQEVVRVIHTMSENVYLETYMKTHYLFQVYMNDYYGFTIPTTEVLLAAISNPIELLTLPKVMEEHRNKIVRDLQLIIEQGLRQGRGYSDIAYEIERQLGFSKNKARTVARTEAGRVQSVASELTYMEAEQKIKGARVEKTWLATLDHRTRMSHRKLDGDSTNSDGYFVYRKNRAKAPLLWEGPDAAALSINCRCTVIAKVNGQLPQVRRGRNYKDETYQKKLQSRIDKLMDKEGMTYAQAFRAADKQIKPPSEVVPFMTYKEWFAQQSS